MVLLLLVLLLTGATSTFGQIQGAITTDPERKAGTDAIGRVLLFTPDPLEPGSSVSHFDTSASPDLLMEPSISSTLKPLAVDLTTQLLADEGWPLGGGADIQLQFSDGAGTGFNDPSLGSARRAALRKAADVWQGILSSSVPIHINAQFSALTCDDTGAVLAQAAANFLFQIAGAAFTNTWYHGPLAEALTGTNLSLKDNADPNAPDISATFNSRIDQDCIGNGSSYYYGLDANAPPGQISFIAVALHEIAHGLGFGNFVNESTGEKFLGDPDIYTQFTRDNVLRKDWARMTGAQIRASATRSGEVVWKGGLVRNRADKILAPLPILRIDPPAPLTGSYTVGTAAFGPDVATTSVSGALAIVNDGSSQPSLGCNPVQNRGAIRNRIALVDRGVCLFTEKVKHAQDAGARGVVVVNNVAGLITMGGSDASITIPTVMLTQTDGEALKRAIRNGDDGLGEEPDDPDDPDDPDPPDDPEPPADPPPEDPSDCVPDTTKLCLTGGRFRVEVTWEKADGESGVGMVELLTDNSGYVYFFDPENVELLIKVLDACSFNQHFWVFAGGLTNVKVEIKVVDTQTGLVKLYQNDLGTAFRPVQDTGAFATCP